MAIEPEIHNLAAAARAAIRLGGALMIGQKTHKWYGTVVGDYNEADAAQNRGIRQEDFGKCDHAIIFPAELTDYGYELGLVKQGDHYVLAFDHWDHKLKDIVGGPECHRFLQEYERACIELQAEQLGYNYTCNLVNDEYELEVDVAGGY